MKRPGLYSMLLGCAICAGIGVASLSRRADASDDVNCKQLAKWSSTHGHYNKGDVVLHKKTASDYHNHAYKCKDTSCVAEPTVSSEWTDQGQCSAMTDPT